jgi:adenine/guanine phosphoribosyltransferase-like PRPP-binding protein
VKELGGDILGMAFLIELAFLEGQKNLDPDIDLTSLLTY